MNIKLPITQSRWPANSNFWRIRDDVDPRIRISADTVRYNLSIFDWAMESLHQLLLAGSEAAAADHKTKMDFPRIFKEVWTVVDTVHRLRILLKSSLPGLKKNQPELQLFRRSTNDFETLRNSIQHISGDLDRMAELSAESYGTLSWTYWADVNAGDFYVFSFSSGFQQRSIEAIVEEARVEQGEQITTPIGWIQLFHLGTCVSISDLIVRVRNVTALLEEWLAPHSGDLEVSLHDVIVMQIAKSPNVKRCGGG